MGYVLELGDVDQRGVMGHQLLRMKMEADCLVNTWDGALPKDELLALCRRYADHFGLENAGNVKARKHYTPPAKRLEYWDEKDAKCIAFVYDDERVEGKIKPDQFGAKSTVCPSCNQPTMGKKTSLAHNVIPQAIWKEIIDAALKQFDQVVRSKVLIDIRGEDGRPLVKGFDTNQSLYADDKGSILPFQDLTSKSPKTVQQLHAINNIYGAQGGAREQCSNCELIQSNATLLQRAQLISENAIPSSYFDAIPQATFIGAQWSSLTVDPMDAANSALVKATLRQVGRYMQGLEDRLALLYGEEENKGYKDGPQKIEPLIFMLWDHMQEFSWAFRAVALEMSRMPYQRSDTALKTKNVMAHVFI